jgi:MarR family transcriptional regulator, organic hydroperoxide resistance regulator
VNGGGNGDGLLPAERKVLATLGHLPLDFRAMWAISNVFRASAAIRRRLEADVLAPHRLSWTGFVGLWVLWVWGEMEAADFADAVGISRPTATGVLKTLGQRGFVDRRASPADRRRVLLRLTEAGERTITDLFPRFNAAEASLAGTLSPSDQERLAAMLRSLLLAVDGDADPTAASGS